LAHDHSTSSSQARLASKDRRRVITVDKPTADSAAGTATAEHMVYMAPLSDAITMVRVYFLPDGALTVDDTNNATLTVYKMGDGGINKTAIYRITTNTDIDNWIAQTGVALDLLVGTVEVNKLLSIEITKAGSGVIVPAGTWHIEYTID
jgi:hypothetical protein